MVDKDWPREPKKPWPYIPFVTYREAKSKYSKDEVGFEHPAKGQDHCGECIHFLPKTRACQIVKGDIGPEDWCSHFKQRKSHGKTNR